MPDSNEKRHSGSADLGEILAALVVFPIGLLLLILIAIPSSYEALDAYRWTSVPSVHIADKYREEKTSNGMITKRHYAVKYSYLWQGSEYSSQRLTLWDTVNSPNSDKIKKALYSRLMMAERAGEEVNIWVNPENPADAVVDRSPHWGYLLALWIAALMFSLAGYGGVRRLFQIAKAPEGDTPWLANPKWRSNLFYSDVRTYIYAYWVLVIALITSGVFLMTAVSDNSIHGSLLIVVFTYLILVAVAICAAIKATQQWWRYGTSPLILDPFPGAIGGDVGGKIQFRIPYQRGSRAETQLTATKNAKRDDGSSFVTTVEWQKDGYASVTEGKGGLAVQFRFTVPQGLPESDISHEHSRFAEYHYEWTLRVSLITPQDEITRNYEIPVYATGEHTSAAITNTSQEHPLLFGIPLRSRFVSYYDIKEVAFKLVPRTKLTEFSQAEHIVYAATDKGEIILAERIAGRRKAVLVAEHLRQLIKLDERLASA